MDENLNNNGHDSGTIESPVKEQRESMQKNADNIRKFTMDDKGRIRRQGVRTGAYGTAAFAGTSRLYIILGWISAALAAFIHPLFAVPGVIFGVLVNRQSVGSGTAIIISNVVLAAINVLLRLFIIAVM